MHEIEAFILTGGKSSRMGSDKAMLRLGGKTFIEIITDELQKAEFVKIRLVGNIENLEPAEKREINILPDVKLDLQKEGNSRASIIGFYSALHYSESEWVFLIACDLPLINAKFIEGLRSKITDDTEAVIPVQPDGRYQPFCAFYKRDEALKAVKETLKSDNWKMTNLLSRLNAKYIEFTPETTTPLFNVNTPDDLKTAIAFASGRPA